MEKQELDWIAIHAAVDKVKEADRQHNCSLRGLEQAIDREAKALEQYNHLLKDFQQVAASAMGEGVVQQYENDLLKKLSKEATEDSHLIDPPEVIEGLPEDMRKLQEEIAAIAAKATIDQERLEDRLSGLSKRIADNWLMTDGLATDIREMNHRIDRIDHLEREVKALSHAVGMLLKDSAAGNSSGDKAKSASKSGTVEQKIAFHEEPTGLAQEIYSALEEFGLPPLSPVKQSIINYISAKKELFYPAQIARELGLCTTYVSRVLKQLEQGNWIKSVDNKGYKGRKLYQVVTTPMPISPISRN